MRLTVAFLVACLPVVAMAEDTVAVTEDTMPASGVVINSSISVNLPLVASDRAGKQAEEDAYRKNLYQRSVLECALLLETIAKACDITSVNISTQINSNPGQADFLYASANISMQVELK